MTSASTASHLLRLGAVLLVLALCSLMGKTAVRAQAQRAATTSTTPQLHYDFPFQTMWDDAVLTSEHSHRPVLVFDLDLIDSNSITLAREVIASKPLQTFLSSRFEVAMNDFAIDPPLSVGLDSLRNLGWRLSGLEKNYGIGVRPCIILIAPDKEEIDRIVYPQRLTATELEARVREILADKNTLHSHILAFWKDPSNIEEHETLIDRFEERGKYDSVIAHLDMVRQDAKHPDHAHTAAIRYADLRMHVEGELRPMNELLAGLGSHGADSVIHSDLLYRLLDFYKRVKRSDSVIATYEKLLHLAPQRDGELVNDYAWYVATYTAKNDLALRLANEAVSKRSQDANVYDTRALAFAHLKDWPHAITDAERAVELSATANEEDKKYFSDQLELYKRLAREEKTGPRDEHAPAAPTPPAHH